MEIPSRSITINKFIETVLSRLPEIPDQLDKDCAIDCISRCEKMGYTIGEATALTRCLEHVSPDLAEDYALAEMKRIDDRVKVRLASIQK